VSRQWFVDAEPMAKMALAAVHSGRIKIVPERFVKVWENWLENIQPWCISRQLWWGHRIPVWYCEGCDHLTVRKVDPTECEACGSANITQDPDVLDTWFSSGLWPFSTLGWPDTTPDLERFYPTDILETGYDILFFWVARMVMDGAMFTNNIPFHTVYLHGLVRDEQGRKMSKSLGNVVDPIDVMDQYGTDALRFTLLTGGTPGNDLNLSLAKVASNRNFANKIWNIARFIVHSLEELRPELNTADHEESALSTKENGFVYTAADQWILYKLESLIDRVNHLYNNYLYGEAGRQIFDFLWGDFADWYLEISKIQLQEDSQTARSTLQILLDGFDTCLRLLHPFIPFVTEETWQQVKNAFQSLVPGISPKAGWSEALIIAEWPDKVDTGQGSFSETAQRFERLQILINRIRATRSEYDVEPGRFITAIIAAGELAKFIEEQKPILAQLARLDLDTLSISETAEAPKDVATISLGDITAYLPLAAMIDVDMERTRMTAELAELEEQIRRLNELLASEFSEKAPPDVVEREREKLERYNASREEIRKRLSALSVMGG
jgi:valyl-tRNA synthetase